jgi:short-subunit dehydrogenase involved in D-alanine esterification of teichoic acids
MPGINDARCILIIGATSGIGRALALALHALPSQPTVVVAGRRKERLDELARDRLHGVQVDVSADSQALKQFVDETIASYPEVGPVRF